MDTDTSRNAFFSAALRRHSSTPGKDIKRMRIVSGSASRFVYGGATEPVVDWVEIGPGAVGTLTRIILRDPEARVVAIEANVGAARSLCRRQDIRPLLRAGRLQVSVLSCVVRLGG